MFVAPRLTRLQAKFVKTIYHNKVSTQSVTGSAYQAEFSTLGKDGEGGGEEEERSNFIRHNQVCDGCGDPCDFRHVDRISLDWLRNQP